MTEINVSAKTPYHTQVNNTEYPWSTCNTTSAVMWLLDCGVPFPQRAGVQPEDELTRVTESPESYEAMRTLTPWNFDRNGRPMRPPREIHVMLDWAVNRWVNREVMRFRDDTTYQTLVSELARGRAVLVCGNFTPQGHVVNLVGVRTRQEREELLEPARVRIDQIEVWTLDDPRGNYWTAYKDLHGNDVQFPFDDFARLTREPSRNRKWAHLYVG